MNENSTAALTDTESEDVAEGFRVTEEEEAGRGDS